MEKSETFHDHLNELKKRLFWIIFSVSISAVLGYLFRNPIINFLDKPLGQALYYTTPGGSFNFVIKVAGIFGVFIALPVFVYQLIRFIEPAIRQKIEASKLIKVMIYSMILALMGAAFAFYVIIPTSLHFFSGYATSTIKPLISANDYINYVINTILCFSVFFQIPLLIDFIDHVTPIKPQKLLQYQKQVIIGALVIAVLLPFTYDPISQFIVALPIIVLYYASVVMLYVKNKKAVRRYSVRENKYLGDLNLSYDLDSLDINNLETVTNTSYVNPELLKTFVPQNLKENPRMNMKNTQPNVQFKKVRPSIDGVISRPKMVNNKAKNIVVYG